MPNTALGITYPLSTDHNRQWEHHQALATTADDAIAAKVPQPLGARAGSDTVLTTTGTVDLNGVTVDVTVSKPTTLVVNGSFDVNCTAFTSTTAFSGECYAGGVLQTGATVLVLTAVSQRIQVANTWLVSVPAGTTTVKLTGRLSAATLTASVRATNTGMTVLGVGG